MNKNLILSGALVFSLGLLSACNGNNGTQAQLAADVVVALQAEMPTYSISTVKLNTERAGWVVIAETNSGVTNYLAVNTNIINTSMNNTTIISTLVSAGANGAQSVTPSSSSGNLYISGSGDVYEDTGEAPKDLEKTGALLEAVQYHDLAKSLVANYGLSEDRSFQVAKLSLQWSKLSKSRSMTEADANSFSKDLIGVNLGDAQAAYAKAQGGDSSAYNSLMSQAAATNGVSPEQMSKIVSQMISH